MADRQRSYRNNPNSIPVSDFLLVRTEALPEVFTNVMRVKAILQEGEVSSVNEAVKIIGMSRSAFYKYRDDVQTYQDPIQVEPITIVASMLSESEALSEIVMYLSEESFKILSISQGLPRKGFSDLMISVDSSNAYVDLVQVRRQLARIAGVRKIDLWSHDD